MQDHFDAGSPFCQPRILAWKPWQTGILRRRGAVRRHDFNRLSVLLCDARPALRNMRPPTLPRLGGGREGAVFRVDYSFFVRHYQTKD